MKMKLVQDANNQLNGKTQWKPEDESDLITFMHVCNGLRSITEESLVRELIPLFKRHGIEVVLLKS